ncbi:hypothetical protein Q0601_12700 [Paracoccus onubensis]|nr:hypothetical protein [Paracoccus onubensis]MDP0928037.1 hypothetical protein [Paracoccus onubensis]
MGISSEITLLNRSFSMTGPFAAQRPGNPGADVIKIEALVTEGAVGRGEA